MSEPHAGDLAAFSRNRAGSQAQSRLAHEVHASGRVVVRSLFVVFALLGGCVIPPSLSVGNEDAGVNSPPAILAVRNDQMDLPDTSQMVVTRGVAAGMISATLLDTDLDDTLFVRFFVDYTIAKPEPPRVTCAAPPASPPVPQRSVTCDISPLCPAAGDFNLSLVVFDREPLEAGTPAYQAMPMGGQKTSWFYFLKCMDAGNP